MYIVGGLEKYPMPNFGHFCVLMDISWNWPSGSTGTVHFFMAYPQNVCNNRLKNHLTWKSKVTYLAVVKLPQAESIKSCGKITKKLENCLCWWKIALLKICEQVFFFYHELPKSENSCYSESHWNNNSILFYKIQKLQGKVNQVKTAFFSIQSWHITK